MLLLLLHPLRDRIASERFYSYRCSVLAMNPKELRKHELDVREIIEIELSPIGTHIPVTRQPRPGLISFDL